eukprot:12069260-Prorocentrum_lima.AAC.1
MSVVVSVSFLPLVILKIILSNPISTFWVDVESHRAWFSVAKFPHVTILLLAFHVSLISDS